jgi:hypothetical protein
VSSKSTRIFGCLSATYIKYINNEELQEITQPRAKRVITSNSAVYTTRNSTQRILTQITKHKSK